jgi:hypothetical protein
MRACRAIMLRAMPSANIFPQTPSEKASKEFGPYKNLLVATQLGNLVLVEKSINTSLGNRAY